VNVILGLGFEPEVAHFSLQFEDRVMKAKHVE